MYKALGFMGLFMGFVSRVLAQYGAPVHFVKTAGLVYSKECETAVPNAKIILVDEVTGARYVTYTNAEGKFSYRFESDWGSRYMLNIEDHDGNKNGTFKTYTAKLDDKDMGYGIGSQPYDYEKKYPLNFYGILPCEKKDSLITEKQPVKEILPAEQNPEDSISDNKGEVPIGTLEVPAFDFKLFPNPNGGAFYIEINISFLGKSELWIYDFEGKLIYLENLENFSAGEQRRISLVDPVPGTYLMIVKTGKETIRKNFVVTR